MPRNQIIIMLKLKKNKSDKLVFVCIHFLKIYIENVMIFKIWLKKLRNIFFFFQILKFESDFQEYKINLFFYKKFDF